jgi:hypothetical protein
MDKKWTKLRKFKSKCKLSLILLTLTDLFVHHLRPVDSAYVLGRMEVDGTSEGVNQGTSPTPQLQQQQPQSLPQPQPAKEGQLGLNLGSSYKQCSISRSTASTMTVTEIKNGMCVTAAHGAPKIGMHFVLLQSAKHYLPWVPGAAPHSQFGKADSAHFHRPKFRALSQWRKRKLYRYPEIGKRVTK